MKRIGIVDRLEIALGLQNIARFSRCVKIYSVAIIALKRLGIMFQTLTVVIPAYVQNAVNELCFFNLQRVDVLSNEFDTFNR